MSTWEENRAAERAESLKERKSCLEKYAEIAKLLEWDMELIPLPTEAYVDRAEAVLIDPSTNAKIRFSKSLGKYATDKVEAHGVYRTHECWRYLEALPSINFSITRPASVLTNDIKRRLIWRVLEYHQRAEEYKSHKDAIEAKRKAAEDQLIGMFPENISRKRHADGVYAKGDVHELIVTSDGSGATLRLHSLPMEKIIAILRIVYSD